MTIVFVLQDEEPAADKIIKLAAVKDEAQRSPRVLLPRPFDSPPQAGRSWSMTIVFVLQDEEPVSLPHQLLPLSCQLRCHEIDDKSVHSTGTEGHEEQCLKNLHVNIRSHKGSDSHVD